MKKHILLITGILFLILQGCSLDDNSQPLEELQIIAENDLEEKVVLHTQRPYKEYETPRTIKSKNKIVVRYKKNTTESQKRKIRKINQVKKYETCKCGDNSLELWHIKENGSINVEEAVDNLRAKGNVEADYEFDMIFKKWYGYGPTNNTSLREMVAPIGTNTTVNIGIIDSGVNYDFFPNPFLYNSRHNGCNNEVSGWDFVNNDNDIRDDHGHGTLVTKLITSNLDRKDIDYRILAAKAFNKDGVGSYWDITCAMNYMTKQSPPMDIINMSFGWYDISGQQILKEMIDKAKSSTLFVTSAGNAGVNTDGVEDSHFPSGYKSFNTVAVGGYKPSRIRISPPRNLTGVKLQEYSNYGKHSIDMIARFGPYNIKLEPKGSPSFIQKASGTSFSSAYTTYRAAKLFNQGTTHPVFMKIGLSLETYISNAHKNRIMEGKVLLRNQ